MRKTNPPRDDNPAMQGEGNYTAGRRYDEATRRHVESGKVDEAAHKAAPKSADEARDMKTAEERGREHARK